MKLPQKMILSDKQLNSLAEAMVSQYGTRLINKNLNSRQKRRFRNERVQ